MKYLYALLLTTSLTMPAFAEQITVTNIEVPNEDTLNISSPVDVTALVGQQDLTSSIGALQAWCIDLYHDDSVGGGQNDIFTISSTLTNGNGQTLSGAVTAEIAHLVAYSAAVEDGQAHTSADASDFSASIQLAIWDDEYGRTFTSNASNYLDQLAGQDMTASLSYNTTLSALVSTGNGQELVVDAVTEPVPEPTSMALLGAGMFGLGFLRRRGASVRTS